MPPPGRAAEKERIPPASLSLAPGCSPPSRAGLLCPLFDARPVRKRRRRRRTQPAKQRHPLPPRRRLWALVVVLVFVGLVGVVGWRGPSGAAAMLLLHVEMLTLLFLALRGMRAVVVGGGGGQDPGAKTVADRYAVFWNSTNPRFQRGDYHIDVCINDYLDVFCPHYEDSVPEDKTERYILYMVNFDGYSSCDHTSKGFKRWECNRPHSPNGPLKFSEKFQLFTPFSLGFEFRPGREYFYISSAIPDNNGRRSCLKLKVFVRPANNCMKTIGVHDRVFDVNDKVENSLEPADDTVHESAEPSRGENAAHLPRISSWLLATLLFLLAMLLTL